MKILPEACPLTNHTATVTDGEFDGWNVTGFYTDGGYRIVGSVIRQVRAMSLAQRAKIVTWVIDQRRAGEAMPMVNSNVLESAGLRRALTYDQRVQRFFLMLQFHGIGLGHRLRYSGLVDDSLNELTGRTWAWMELTSSTEQSQMINAIVGEDLLAYAGDSLNLTAAGIRKLDSIVGQGAESGQAFIAMWFSPKMSEAYSLGFELGVTDAGYRALRIDQKEHANKIDDEIIAEIRRSRFVIADFTCEVLNLDSGSVAVPRGGVYYEAGFAQGLGIPVIWTVRADCIEYVHFDTRQYSHIVWENPDDLRTRLRNRIGAVIGAPSRR